MARLKLLAAILLICGCDNQPAAPPPVPEPASLRIGLRPASFMHFGWREYDWDLAPGSTGAVPPPGGPESRNWFTLSLEGRPRFLFCEQEDRLCIYRRGTSLFEPFAQLPLTLNSRMTWTSLLHDRSGRRNQTAYCIAVGDEFRVDFTDAGRTAHSMWFSPVDGLVRWKGIETTPLVRRSNPLLLAAQSYSSFGRVDDDARWAPDNCRAPVEPPLRKSASRDEATHGRKLYYLFARDRQAYLRARDLDQPDGQVVVKESWVQEKKGPLFIMMKSLGEWTYATATPDGAEITASGRIASCIECHESASTRDRMFGLRSP